MIVDPLQAVSVHTASGVQLHQFLPEHQSSLLWTRNLRETSRCELVVPAIPGMIPRDAFTPWRDWISVWDSAGRDLYWTGPIVAPEGDHDTWTVNAVDVSYFGRATNVPITKRYETADPADIAAEMYAHMARQHNLRIRPHVRRDPEGDPFDFQVKQDEESVKDVIEELAGLGLYWSVVSGVPVLGPARKRAVVALSEDDFVEGGLRWVRDGRESFNEVLVRGADALARVSVPMGSLRLQKIVNIDDMFGVPNVQRAADQHVRQTGFIRDVITVPGGAKLHPDAPVAVEHLIPSTRFNVEAFGMLQLMELESVEVRAVSGDVSVGVSLEAVRPRTDLGDAESSGGGGES